MRYPIVKVKTRDGLTLGGLLLEPKTRTLKTIKIHFHGDADNFYGSEFYPPLANSCIKQGMAFLSVNHRGSGVFENSSEDPVPHGVATEFFSDCVKDFDAWIKFALDEGYEKIILEGHSRGTEKTVYYLTHGRYKHKVVGVILLGFSDAIGTQLAYEKNIGHNFLAEAKKLAKSGLGEHLLSDLRAFAGELPMTANTYLDTMKKNSANWNALPLRKGKDLKYFQQIKVPILGIIGNQEEYTVIPIKKAIALLMKENKKAEVYQIKNCKHGFVGKEKEMAKIVTEFTKRRILQDR